MPTVRIALGLEYDGAAFTRARIVALTDYLYRIQVK